MLFDFHSHIESLKIHPEKQKIIMKYESMHGPISGDIKEQVWYRDYITQFSSHPIATPNEVATMFDWDLLVQLVAASFSSDASFENLEEGNKNLIISVKS